MDDFNFLPDAPSNPNTESGTGGQFSSGNSIFFDHYLHHLDLHNLFSTPPRRNQFILEQNYRFALNYFREENIQSKLDFYGDDTDYESLINGYTQFQNPTFLNDVVGQVDAEIPNDLFSGIEKPKMKINDRFGMFSFDLASMAMTYVYEYYDKKNNILDVNDVEKMGAKFISRTTNEEVYQRIKRRENGTPVVVSSVRNSLIDFEKKEKKQRAVEIFVLSSFAGAERTSSLLYNSMAAISVAKNLILKGFQVKITAIIVMTMENRNYYHLIPTKRYNQPLDINATAYVCGDTRFFRYQGFKAVHVGFDKTDVINDGSFGYIIRDKNMIVRNIETDYVPNSGLKQADTRLYFGGARNINDVKNEVNEALEILNQNYGNNN
jgi:hypothetical protein